MPRTSRFTNADIAPGSVVTYTTFTGARRTVKVTLVDPDIKNGRPGFDGVCLDALGRETGETVWGYTSDIVGVR